MNEFLIIFLAITFTALFINMKISRIAVLIALKQEEDKNETKAILLIMLLASLFWSIYAIL